jgi:hypothetical protein
MDATIAHGYELNRPEYQRVVGSFSHKSFPDAQELCLTAFDELAQIGHDAFRRQHDPYYDTTLVMASAQPIIDLPRAPAKRREPRDGEVHSEAADWP